MSNTSATGGPLSPEPPLPFDDVQLDKVFQNLATNLTGLPGNYVRPRWQAGNPLSAGTPKQPEPGINWCAIGVTSVIQDDGPWIVYNPNTNNSLYWDHEEIEVIASFYGPNSQSNARLLRAGLNVPQNTEVLLQYMIRYVSCSQIRQVPELVNEQWIKRQDVMFFFRRKFQMIYDTENILIADINLIDDTSIDDTIIVPPGSQIKP